jgi:hypothetical protein
VLILSGCGAINLGKYKGIERTDSDENYYLVKNIYLSAGSSAIPKTYFDHTVHGSVNVVFTANNEPNHYVSKTIWYDPTGAEFRTIRQTHDKKVEGDKGEWEPKGGATRIHSIPLKDLAQRQTGLWKVELYMDDKLARRLTFTVR